MSEESEERHQQSANRLANRITQAAEHGQRFVLDISRTIGRTAASAGELLTDAELRRKGRILLAAEASRGIREIQQKVGSAAENLGRSLQQGAGTIQRGIASGNKQLQGALERVRARVNEARLEYLVELHNNKAVDVQIATKLYEDAPQEIRSRLWAALTQDPTLNPFSTKPPEDSDLIDLQSIEGSPMKDEEDDWEMIESPFRRKSKDHEQEGDNAMQLETLLEAMSTIEWPLSERVSEDSNYGILIQITIGQDEIDEIIRRDIHRTFPELPHFNFPEKRVALFNILKAYSLHDLEVGYCQGMGFVAGILLLYLPEEWAFRMLCVLMNERQVNLRRLYVPGLEPLKMELWKLEWLLEKHLPNLNSHLQKYSVSAMLYASQWFLTCFACPFTDSFAARVLDFMILEKSSTVPLLRTAFAVLSHLAPDLLEISDFEELLTQIKVKPLSWNVPTVRQVLSDSLICPITREQSDLAEEQYHAIHPESRATEGNLLPDLDAPNVEEREETKTNGHTHQPSGELEFVLSMDLLLDVDVPQEDPINDSKTE